MRDPQRHPMLQKTMTPSSLTQPCQTERATTLHYV